MLPTSYKSHSVTEYVMHYDNNELFSLDEMEERQNSLGSTPTIFNPTFYDPFEIKHRRRTSRKQFKVLEKAFSDNPKPSGRIRQKLAYHLAMTPRGVQVWFQNRRAKAKQKHQQHQGKGCRQHDQFADGEIQDSMVNDLQIGNRSICSSIMLSPSMMVHSTSHSSMCSSYYSESMNYNGNFQGYSDNDNQNMMNMTAMFVCSPAESSDPLINPCESSYMNDKVSDEEAQMASSPLSYPSRNGTSSSGSLRSIEHWWLHNQEIMTSMMGHETPMNEAVTITSSIPIPDEITYLGNKGTIEEPNEYTPSAIPIMSLKSHNQNHMDAIVYNDSLQIELGDESLLTDKQAERIYTDKPSYPVDCNRYVTDWIDTIPMQSSHEVFNTDLFNTVAHNTEDVWGLLQYKQRNKLLDIRRYSQPSILHQPNEVQCTNQQTMRRYSEPNHPDLYFPLFDSYADNNMLYNIVTMT